MGSFFVCNCLLQWLGELWNGLFLNPLRSNWCQGDFLMQWSETWHYRTSHKGTKPSYDIIWIYALGIFLVKSDVLNISFANSILSLVGYIAYSNSNLKDFHGKTKPFWHLTSGFLLTTRCSPISRFWAGDCIRPHPHLHSRRYEIPEEAIQERPYSVHQGPWKKWMKWWRSFAGKMDSFWG